MDDDFYKQHAQRVRDLADKADPFTRKRLLDLADKYDAKDQQAEPGIEDDRAADTRASGPNPFPAQTDIGRFLPEAQPRLGGLGAWRRSRAGRTFVSRPAESIRPRPGCSRDSECLKTPSNVV